MTHAARLAELVNGLVTTTTNIGIGDARHKQLCTSASASLRPSGHSRTNQFAVKSTVDGLVEKFAVLNRDDLADALRSRLDELPSTSDWIPEVLSLLLNLSDRPLQHTRLEALIELNAGDSTALHNDVYDDNDSNASDPELWENIERGYHSSGDDVSAGEDDTDLTISTIETSQDDANYGRVGHDQLTAPNLDLLKPFRFRERSDELDLGRRSDGQERSEVETIRQMLSLLAGAISEADLPTDALCLQSTSRASFEDVIRSFARVSRSLANLRRWCLLPQTIPFIRTIQMSVASSLNAFKRKLAMIEQSYIAPQGEIVVSILDVETRVRDLARPLIALSALITDFAATGDDRRGCSLLDRLHDEACIAQMAGDDAVSSLCQNLFIDGMQVYLRAATVWIQTGSIHSEDQQVFFVKTLDQDCPLQDVWHRRYQLDLAADGSVMAPKCLAAFVGDIFASGKAKMMTKLLTRKHSNMHSDTIFTRDTHGFVLETIEACCFQPYSSAVEEALTAWFLENRGDCFSELSAQLATNLETADAMQALPYVYLGKDATILQYFGDAAARKIHALASAGGDDIDFVLSELAQILLGDHANISSSNISAEFVDQEAENIPRSITSKLGGVRLKYELPWTLQNITRCRQPKCYADISALLLQASYAANSLRTHFHRLRSLDEIPRATSKLRLEFLNLCELVIWHITTTGNILHQNLIQHFRLANDLEAMITIWSEHERRMRANFLLTTNLRPLRTAMIQLLECCEIISPTMRPDAVRSLQVQFGDTVRFLVTGVRAVGRAGGESSLETFADRLEWLLAPRS